VHAVKRLVARFRRWIRVRRLVREYLGWFEVYHATFAFRRVTGWPGPPAKAPPDVAFAYSQMMDAFVRLYAASRGEPPPDNWADPEVLERFRLKS
jgi:hypothetical protein